MIILDPVWNIHALSAHDGADTHKALLSLPGRITHEDQHPLSPLQLSFQHSLLIIVDLLAGQNVMDHVYQFLDDFDSLVLIPEHVLSDNDSDGPME